jgi:hypothetical protein
VGLHAATDASAQRVERHVGHRQGEVALGIGRSGSERGRLIGTPPSAQELYIDAGCHFARDHPQFGDKDPDLQAPERRPFLLGQWLENDFWSAAGNPDRFELKVVAQQLGEQTAGQEFAGGPENRERRRGIGACLFGDVDLVGAIGLHRRRPLDGDTLFVDRHPEA